jgi:hypothetical protein
MIISSYDARLNFHFNCNLEMTSSGDSVEKSKPLSSLLWRRWAHAHKIELAGKITDHVRTADVKYFMTPPPQINAKSKTIDATTTVAPRCSLYQVGMQVLVNPPSTINSVPVI